MKVHAREFHHRRIAGSASRRARVHAHRVAGDHRHYHHFGRAPAAGPGGGQVGRDARSMRQQPEANDHGLVHVRGGQPRGSGPQWRGCQPDLRAGSLVGFRGQPRRPSDADQRAVLDRPRLRAAGWEPAVGKTLQVPGRRFHLVCGRHRHQSAGVAQLFHEQLHRRHRHQPPSTAGPDARLPRLYEMVAIGSRLAGQSLCLYGCQPGQYLHARFRGGYDGRGVHPLSLRFAPEPGRGVVRRRPRRNPQMARP